MTRRPSTSRDARRLEVERRPERRPARGTSPASRAGASASPPHSASTTNAPARAAVHAPCTIGRGSPAIRAASTDRCSGLRSPPTRANASIDGGRDILGLGEPPRRRPRASALGARRGQREQRDERPPTPRSSPISASAALRRCRVAVQRGAPRAARRRRLGAHAQHVAAASSSTLNPRLVGEEVGVAGLASVSHVVDVAAAQRERGRGRVDEDRQLGLDLGDHAARARQPRARSAAASAPSAGSRSSTSRAVDVARLARQRRPRRPGSHGVRRVHELGDPRGELRHREQPGERRATRASARDRAGRRRAPRPSRRGTRGQAARTSTGTTPANGSSGGARPSAAAANAARAASPPTSTTAPSTTAGSAARARRRRVDRDHRVAVGAR